MRKKSLLGAMLCLCICFLTCTAYAASTADAKEPIDPDAACSLTLRVARGETVFPNVSVSIYRVASVSSDFRYTLTENFLPTDLTVNGITTSGEWDAVRTTLESYIAAEGISPDHTALTDASGELGVEGLAPGLYLVGKLRCEAGETCYLFDSALIALPDLDESGFWLYDVAVTPKSAEYERSDGEKEYQVIKLWRDNGAHENRPDSVTIDIMCNGELVERVILSDENGWAYTWRASDNGDIWQVAEREIPDGYRVTVEEHAGCFTVINTLPGTPESPPTGDSANIGLYLALMCLSGLLLMLIGSASRKKSES